MMLPIQTETLFQTFSQFAQTPNLPAQPTEEEKTTEAKIKDLLEKVCVPAVPGPPCT
jgi:golgi SNAP receptor complex member 1